jgi:hypothetical protein
MLADRDILDSRAGFARAAHAHGGGHTNTNPQHQPLVLRHTALLFPEGVGSRLNWLACISSDARRYDRMHHFTAVKVVKPRQALTLCGDERLPLLENVKMQQLADICPGKSEKLDK